METGKLSVQLWQYSTAASRKMDPFAWQAAGMGYVIRTASNRFVVIDGGFEEDAEPLIDLMRRESGEEKPEVVMWILTHPHDDHANALIHISQTQSLQDRLHIENVVFQLPANYVQKRGADCSDTLHKIHQIPELLGCRHVCPEAGDVLWADGLQFKFYFCWKDMECEDPNELSLVFKLSGTKTVMFTGDAYEGTLETVLKRFAKEELKCDVCQAAHHGLNGGNHEFYQAVGAKLVLSPIAKPAFEAMLYGAYKDDPQAEANRILMLDAMQDGKQLVLSADGDFCLELG